MRKAFFDSRQQACLGGARGCASVLFFGLVFGQLPLASGQTAGINQGGPQVVHAPAGSEPMPQHGSEAVSRVDQMRQAEKRKRIAADTARLAQLSSELKVQLDQAPADMLSVDALRKAAEIEKIAHDLRQWLQS